MHGIIHAIYKNFIVGKFGERAWTQIVKEAGSQIHPAILSMRSYSDLTTLRIMSIGCKVLSMPTAPVFEEFGGYFIEYLMDNGYGALLRACGTSLYTFLQNLNNVHRSVERDFDSAIFPVFEVLPREALPSKAAGSNENPSKGDCFQMQYITSRIDFRPFLRGALSRVASQLFNSSLDIKAVKTEDLGFHILETWQLTVTPLGPTIDECEEPQRAGGWSCMPTSILSGCPAVCCSRSPSGGDCHPTTFMYAATNPEIQEKARDVISLTARGGSDLASCAKFYAGMDVLVKVKLIAVLLRGVKAGLISASWADGYALQEKGSLWTSRLGNEGYSLSSDWFTEQMNGGPRLADTQLMGCAVPSGPIPRSLKNESMLRYVSHSWIGVQTTTWVNTSPAQANAAELCLVAKEIASNELGDVSCWTEVSFWIEWCCVPPDDLGLRNWCSLLAPDFLCMSEHLVVLCSASYFSNLWCAYEWVFFLALHDPLDIIVCADAYLNAASLSKYLNAIQGFRVRSCECPPRVDRTQLLERITFGCTSLDAFEHLLQFTAIALMAYFVATRRCIDTNAAMKPWIELALSCKFDELATVLEGLRDRLPKWRQNAVMKARNGQAHSDLHSILGRTSNMYFSEHIAPLIDELKRSSFKPGLIEEFEKVRQLQAMVSEV